MGGVYGLMSIGLTLIWGVMDVINFAHGDMLMLGMYMTFWLVSLYMFDPYVALIIVIPTFFVLGLVIHRSIVEPVLKGGALMSILVTLGLSMIMQNGALLAWSVDFRFHKTWYYEIFFRWGGLSVDGAKLIAYLGSTVISVMLYFFLKKTSIGKAIRAVAQNPEAARAIGINIKRIRTITFGIGSVAAGIAGTFMSVFFYTYPYIGLLWTIFAFVIVCLGGMGNFMGAYMGGLIIGVVEGFSSLLLMSAYRNILVFLIFIIILLVKPSGLFGRALK